MIRDYTRIYIDGAWVQPLDGKIIDIINPATERPAGQITLCTAADVDRAVAVARKAFTSFSRSSRQERVDLLSSILGVYAKREDDLADALTEELGAPKKFAKDVQAGVGLLHLQTAIAILRDYKFEYPQSNRTVIRREPIGVVGVITPWVAPKSALLTLIPTFNGCGRATFLDRMSRAPRRAGLLMTAWGSWLAFPGGEDATPRPPQGFAPADFSVS